MTQLSRTHPQTVSHLLETIQHFALKLTSNIWSADYSSLLSLQHRRNKVKLIFLFRQKFSLSHSNNSPLSPQPPSHYLTCHYSPHNFQPIFCKTSSFSTLYLSAIRLWNSLSDHIKFLNSISLFRSLLNNFSVNN